MTVSQESASFVDRADGIQPGEYWEACPEDAPIGFIHEWAERHPEAPVYMDTGEFNKAQNAIRELAGASELLSTIPSLLERLSEHTYPEAVGLREQIMAGLGNVATALQETTANLGGITETSETATASDVRSALVLAESGIYFDARHPISNLK